MSGLTGESQTLGQPSRPGLADDNIWTVVERPNLQPDSKQLAPGSCLGKGQAVRWSAESGLCTVVLLEA